MFSFFNSLPVNIHSLSFETFNWELQKNNKRFKQWVNPEHTMALSVNFFKAKPDLPTILDTDVLRIFYRDMVKTGNGGLISVNSSKILSFNCVEAILKFPQKAGGYLYLGSITIPFETCSYVIKIQAPELPPYQTRQDQVKTTLLEEGEVIENTWLSDPYDDTITGNHLMDLSEKKLYDMQFPKHPLSVARNILPKLLKSIRFDENFKALNPLNR